MRSNIPGDSNAGRPGRGAGASIRIAVKDRQAPVPVLDIKIDPRTPESEFPDRSVQTADLTSGRETVSIGEGPAEELTLHWKSNGEIAFIDIHPDGAFVQFAAEAGLRDFHASPWREIVSTFRGKDG